MKFNPELHYLGLFTWLYIFYKLSLTDMYVKNL